MNKKLLEIVEEKFYEPIGLFLGILFLISCFSSIDGFIENYLGKKYAATSYLIILLSYCVFWLYKRFRLPKSKAGKAGIVICVFAENEKEQKNIRNDLVHRLKREISSQGLFSLVDTVIIPNHLAKSIQSPETIKNANKKIKGHFWIYGQTRRRTNKIYLDLEGWVIHAPLSTSISAALGREFREALPQRVEFTDELSFVASELTGEHIFKVAQYIIGVAAYLSGDPLLAIQLHSRLINSLNLALDVTPNFVRLKGRLPELLSNEHLVLAQSSYNKKELPEAKDWLLKALTFKHDNYAVWLLKSVVDFLENSESKDALRSIEAAQKYSGSRHEWKYSRAFLLYWHKRYEEAVDLTRQISKLEFKDEEKTISDVQKFNREIIESGRAMSGVYFWSGYLNYKIIGNLEQAYLDFRKFLELANDKDEILKLKSISYLSEINKENRVRHNNFTLVR